MEEPRFETIDKIRLVGIKMHMTLADNRTSELWQSFVPRLKELERDIAAGLYSVQIYPKGFSTETASVPFEKWAAAPSKGAVPDGMDELVIPGGNYAVFIHYGPVSKFQQTIQHIFGKWFPQSGYTMAPRPQFEIMGPEYKGPEHPDSREEVWIPIEKI